MTPRSERRPQTSARRLFVVYALMSLAPVLILGAVLLALLNAQNNRHGMAEGQAKADLLARATIAPLLSGSDLRPGLTKTEQTAVQRSVHQIIANHQVLRLRLRDLDGKVIYSDDGSGHDADVDEALKAAHGEPVVSLTRLNADEVEDGADVSPGPKVVEIYLPLDAMRSHQRIGVLELYLPYAPIAADTAQGRRMVVLALTGGLMLLWLSLLGVTLSVTRRLRRQASANAFLASHDALTGMPNRVRFAERARVAVNAATPTRPVAIALLDLDRFKEVNDTLGHSNGDLLLVQLADRLELRLRDGDTIARLGGDEFAIVLGSVRSAGEAVEVLSRLRLVMAEPIHINGLPIAVQASAGFALAPQDGSDVELLQQHAEVAMYVAKRQHLGVAQYRPEQDQYDASALTLIAELGQAIANDELVLHYQPKGDLRRGVVVGVEALVRWRHPTRGLLYPDTFLPAAEQTELIEDLTRWVLRTATTDLPALDPTGQLAVAVNISARSLSRPDFARDILDVLARTGIDRSRVILEITETALMADPGRAALSLTELNRAGLRISIDDFGAGRTSLSYLAKLPISELKIDKAFVLAMLTDNRNAAIVRSVIELGHSLGFNVTAEGVETVEILEELGLMRCDTVQGFLLAKPSGAVDLAQGVAHAHAVLRAPAVIPGNAGNAAVPA